MVVWLSLTWLASTLLVVWLTNKYGKKPDRRKDWDGFYYD